MATTQFKLRQLQQDSAASDNLIKWNGSEWVAGTASNASLESGVGGIYKGSGTIPDNTVATLTSTGDFTIDYNGAVDGFRIRDDLGSIFLQDKTAAASVTVDSTQALLGFSSNSFLVNTSYAQLNTLLRVQSGYIALDSALSPSQITADQNNYAPTGINTASILRLNSDASRNITGLVNGGTITAGRLLTIYNIGSNNIVLINESASSTAANRFLFGTDVTIGPNQSVILIYDGTSSRWRTATAVPGDGDGNGIYSGSGTIPTGTTATLDTNSLFRIAYSNSNPALEIDDDTAGVIMSSESGNSYFGASGNNFGAGATGEISLASNGYELEVSANGSAVLLGPPTFGGKLVFVEPSGGGSHFSSIAAQAQAASIDYTLPASATTGLLHNDGSNVWSWSTVSNSDLASGVGGIYKGSGTIPSSTVATLTTNELFSINYSGVGNEAIVVDDFLDSVVLKSANQNSIITIQAGNIELYSSGGYVNITSGTSGAQLRLYEPSGSGSNYTGFIAGALSGNQMYTLPTDTPNDGEFLRWNTGGTLDWAAASGADGNGIYTGSGNIASATVATIADESTFTIDYFDGSNALHFVDNGETFSLTSGAAYGINANSSQVQMIGPNSDYVSVTATGPVARGGLSITNGFLALANDVTPSQITSDQNNYSPTNLDEAAVLRLSSDASRTITGIDASVRYGDGDILTLINIGSNNIVLSDDDAASSAANRMFLGGTDITLAPEFSITLIYDDTSNVWRPFNLTGSGSADGNGIYSGSGTISGSATATLQTGATFTIAYFGANPAIQINDTDESVVIYDKDGVNYVYVDDLGVDVYGVHSVILNTTPATDHYASGTKITLTANENQAFGDAVYINTDGEAQLADADALASAKVIGICTETVTANNPGTYLIQGIARDDTWTWTVGGYVYLSTTGTTGNTLTQTAPTGTDDCVVIIGIATHADRMIINPSYSITVLE